MSIMVVKSVLFVIRNYTSAKKETAVFIGLSKNYDIVF